MGGTETDLLREVTLTSSVKGRRMYEPMHLQYVPIRKNVIDTVEVGISETDGTQTQFNGGETILTANFRKTADGSYNSVPAS